MQNQLRNHKISIDIAKYMCKQNQTSIFIDAFSWNLEKNKLNKELNKLNKE